MIITAITDQGEELLVEGADFGDLGDAAGGDFLGELCEQHPGKTVVEFRLKYTDGESFQTGGEPKQEYSPWSKDIPTEQGWYWIEIAMPNKSQPSGKSVTTYPCLVTPNEDGTTYIQLVEGATFVHQPRIGLVYHASGKPLRLQKVRFGPKISDAPPG
jgi:hypothetical protein